jgi:hypothetical protein
MDLVLDANRNPPSPTTVTTGRSGRATLTPRAAGNPKPNVPMYEVDR